MEKVVKVYKGEFWHRALERRPIQFGMLALVAVLIGGIVELVPTFLVKSNVPTIASVQPYTPLELQGRDIYVREGVIPVTHKWSDPSAMKWFAIKENTQKQVSSSMTTLSNGVVSAPVLTCTEKAVNRPMHGITGTCMSPPV